MNTDSLRMQCRGVFWMGMLAVWLAILSVQAEGPASASQGGSSAAAPHPSASTAPYTNSLGMKFVAVPGSPVLFSVWETRVQDFAAFVRETGYAATEGVYSLGTNRWKQQGHTWQSPGFPQNDRHPVCAVSWNDAQAFCAWLSKKEGRRYRLPSDLEWSQAVGLTNEVGATPFERSRNLPEGFPWGKSMPPNVNGLPAGNYAGAEAKEIDWPEIFRVIPDFRDPFARTAPVGSFPPNANGLYDLGGNVWEWCEDPLDPIKDSRVLRGGSWVDNLEENIRSGYRNPSRPINRVTSIGFRCVLEPAGTQP